MQIHAKKILLGSATVTQTLIDKSTVAEAQRRNFSQITMQGREIFTHLLPFIQERSRTCPSTFPNLNVKFQVVKKQPIDCYQAELHFSQGTITKEARMAVGNVLMSEIRKLSSFHANKPRLNVTICNVEGRILCQRDNILLQAPGLNQEMMDLSNQAIMDDMANILLKKSSTHFVINIEMHE